MRQVRTEKVNESEPPMRCRNSIDDIETRVPLLLWDKSGRNLLTALAVSGIEVARARFRRQRGTWERLANCERESTCAGQAGGPPRSSGDVPVMGTERRGRIVPRVFAGQPGCLGGAG